MCGTSPAWQRSRALLGSINNIPRSRVQDLQNPDTDHPLAPHWRVPFMNDVKALDKFSV